MSEKKIAVLGAGTMGAGIAQLAAQSGFEVLLYDLKDDFVLRGLTNIRTALQERVDQGKMTPEDMAAFLARIHPTTNREDAASWPVVIEAAPEDLALKKDMFGALSAISAPGRLSRPRASASAAAVPIAVATTVVTPATSRLLRSDMRICGLVRSRPYQPSVKPFHSAVSRLSLNEKTTSTRIGAYKKRYTSAVSEPRNGARRASATLTPPARRAAAAGTPRAGRARSG